MPVSEVGVRYGGGFRGTVEDDGAGTQEGRPDREAEGRAPGLTGAWSVRRFRLEEGWLARQVARTINGCCQGSRDARLTTRVALLPPKANELLIA